MLEKPSYKFKEEAEFIFAQFQVNREYVLDHINRVLEAIHGDGEAPVFTENWTEEFKKTAKKWLLPYYNSPFTFMEVGIYEGRSALWVIENCMTHPDSKYIGVDFWLNQPEVRKRALANIKPDGKRRTIIESLSINLLLNQEFTPEAVDVFYVDGRHDFATVLADSHLALLCTKPHGLIIWDDYQNQDQPQVGKAVDIFLQAMGDKVRVMSTGWQLVGRKHE